MATRAKAKAKKTRKKKEEVVETPAEDTVPVEDASTGEVEEVLNPSETINPDDAPRPKKKLVSSDGTTDVPAKPHKNVVKLPDDDHNDRKWFRVATARWSPPSEDGSPVDVIYNEGDLVFLTPTEANWAFLHNKIQKAAPPTEEEKNALKSQAHIS